MGLVAQNGLRILGAEMITRPFTAEQQAIKVALEVLGRTSRRWDSFSTITAGEQYHLACYTLCGIADLSIELDAYPIGDLSEIRETARKLWQEFS